MVASRVPSYAQRIVLAILFDGGFVDAGEPGVSCPRLYHADACLFALMARSTFDVIRRHSWVHATTGPTGRTRYIASVDGRRTARTFKP